MKQIQVGMITNSEGAHLSAYFDALNKAEEVDGVFLADQTGGTFAQATKTLGAKLKGTFTSPQEMLGKSHPPMALISLEAALAPDAIHLALDSGCHTFAEKPACVRLADFQTLVQKAESKHLHLMLALANRLNSPVKEARRLLRSGQFGKVYGLDMHIVADQTRLTRPEYHKTWFADKSRSGGGHLIWLGIHWLDLASFITGLSIREVTAMTENVGGQPINVEDSAALIMRFETGILGTLTSGYYLDKGYQTQIKIWCEHGWMELPGLDNGVLQYFVSKGVRDPQVQRFEPTPGQGGYAPFVRAAVRASAGLSEPPITSRESLRALQTVFACYRAAETGQKQSITE